MYVKIILNKNTGKVDYEGIGRDGAKVDIIEVTEDFVFLKQGGSTGYVHRGIGSVYSSACYKICKLIKTVNYKDEIEFTVDFVLNGIPVKNTNQRIIEKIETKVPISKRPNPLDLLPPRDREIVENNLRMQKELSDRITERLKNEGAQDD